MSRKFDPIYFIGNLKLLVIWRSINEMSRVGNRYIYNTWNLNDSSDIVKCYKCIVWPSHLLTVML